MRKACGVAALVTVLLIVPLWVSLPPFGRPFAPERLQEWNDSFGGPPHEKQIRHL